MAILDLLPGKEPLTFFEITSHDTQGEFQPCATIYGGKPGPYPWFPIVWISWLKKGDRYIGHQCVEYDGKWHTFGFWYFNVGTLR